MSLSKQLLFLISLVFLIVFSISFFLSMDSIRRYLEVESEVHVQDTATSLGLSLSPHMDDEDDPILETMMNAIFDMGYYQEMRLTNIDGENLVILTNPVKMDGIPQWLIELFPMKAATAITEISSGWNISGTLTVSGNPAYAYARLYEQGKKTLLYSLIVFVGAFALLMLILRFILQPLRAIQKQANEISTGNFSKIERLPWTREVRVVAQSMNSMSGKIGDTITRLNLRLESLSDSLKRDPLTKLLNQSSFNEDIKRALTLGGNGYIFYLKFDDLASIGRDKGNQFVDQLLGDFADILQNIAPEGSSAYRLYGAEFAVVSADMSDNDLTSLAENLKLHITDLGKKYGIDDMMHIGVVHFDRSCESTLLMPALIEAYEQARLIGHNAFYIKQDSFGSLSEQEWKTIINTTIHDKKPLINFTTEAYNYSAANSPVKVMQEAFTVISDESDNILSSATFFSMAQAFNLAIALDKCIVDSIIRKMEDESTTTPVTINLSLDSIASVDFQDWLRQRLADTHLSPNLLAFSITAYAAAKNIAAFSGFSLIAKSIGATVLLKRYSSDNIPLDNLRGLQIDYIRLSRHLTTDISDNASKSDFLDIIQQMATLMDIRILAEGVIDDDDFTIVKRTGLYGISR